MRQYSGFEYLLIDAANNAGLDKLLFEERIQWGMDNLHTLETEVVPVKTTPLFIKAVMAIRKAQLGIPTGHMVGLDATCSGIQMMSAMTGCIVGANSTGLVDPDRRADAYTDCNNEMKKTLGPLFDVPRDDSKSALMKSFYGSKKVPKDLFGEDTPELNAFYAAAVAIAPGAWELLQDLLGSWNSYALVHEWKLPDGYDARVKVMETVEARIEVDELDHASFSYEYKENRGQKDGLSNAANVTHSMDAWVLRSMHRRCNYDRISIERAGEVLYIELMDRIVNGEPAIEVTDMNLTEQVAYYIEQFNRSTLADAVILPHLTAETVRCLSRDHIEKLRPITMRMLAHKPFELITVHDEFKAHANNCNHVRQHYIDIMAEIAESNVLDDLLSQVYGTPGTFTKLSTNLGELIRQSNYALT